MASEFGQCTWKGPGDFSLTLLVTGGQGDRRGIGSHPSVVTVIKARPTHKALLQLAQVRYR
jgi:hypothetical protein